MLLLSNKISAQHSKSGGYPQLFRKNIRHFAQNICCPTSQLLLGLLVHRSGLGLGAGDLLFVPRTNLRRAESVAATVP